MADRRRARAGRTARGTARERGKRAGKDAPLISGTQSYVYSINAPSAGSFSVQMRDLNFLAALSELGIAVATSTGLVGKLEGAGEMDFDISGPGNYYAIVFGKSAGRLDVGQLWFSLAFSPLSGPALCRCRVLRSCCCPVWPARWV